MTNASITGRTINYTGDMANAPRTGFVSAVETDRWGTHAVVIWDQTETTGWHDDGEALSIKTKADRIAVHLLANEATAKRSDRFIIAA